MEAGIVGLPNVGKSTLFNALTNAGIASENYPFCTIEPNVGVVAVPDPQLARINRHITTQKVIPAPWKQASRCCGWWTSRASSRAPARARD